MAQAQIRPAPQKVIGILGGMSNQATAEYYQMINDKLNKIYGGWDNGEIVIASVNFGNIEYFIRNDLWTEARAYLSEKVALLERAGVDVIGCVSNTMHQVVEPIMETRATPFIHIADPTGAAIRAAGLSKVALLGTLPTMRSDMLRARYKEKFGVELLIPNAEDATSTDRIIFDELVRGEVCRPSRDAYLAIIAKLRAQGAQGVILGCTEIFMLIGEDDLPGFPVFDTTRLHVEALVAFAAGTA